LAHHERGCTRKQKRATQARQAFATSTVAQRF
jgi:hypothetical protein